MVNNNESITSSVLKPLSVKLNDRTVPFPGPKTLKIADFEKDFEIEYLDISSIFLFIIVTPVIKRIA